MIASVIGKTLVGEYNRREGTSYSAEEFFNTVFHPVFYGHEKYLQWVTNSPFVQGYKKSAPPNKSDQLKRLETFTEKVHSEDSPDASYAIGFAAAGSLGTTSGQVTDLAIPLNAEDIYSSWIGSGLGIGVKGGFSLFFNHPEILWKIYEGWKVYRAFLKEYDNLRSNQIDTWNGQWFTYACSEDYGNKPSGQEMSTLLSSSAVGGLEFKTQPWTEVLFAVADQFKERQITGYVYSLGQMNTTIGFIPFELPEMLMPLQFYIDIFGENEFLNNKDKIKKMYGTAHPFRIACQKGVIGTSALEPKDLVQYMQSARGKVKNPDFEKADQDKRISFNVYQTWLLAMLNNKELWERANDAAEAYLEYVAGSKKVSTQRERAIEEALSATSKRKFIEASIPLVENADVVAPKISALVQEVNMMQEDNFRYFLTLIKFRYAFWKNQKQGEN